MTSYPDIVGIGTCTVDHLMPVPHMPVNNETMRVTNYMRQTGGLASSSLVAAGAFGRQNQNYRARRR